MTKRLLVVDDEPNLLRALAAALRGEGYEVTTARHGREALVRVAESLPDLIVSDIRMPVMDGYQLARSLRDILARVERTHAQIARLVGAQGEERTAFARDEELTEAERRVAEAVARGLSNKEIAAELRISIRTVENHISHILSKKSFSNHVEIARHVLERSSPA